MIDIDAVLRQDVSQRVHDPLGRIDTEPGRLITPGGPLYAPVLEHGSQITQALKREEEIRRGGDEYLIGHDDICAHERTEIGSKIKKNDLGSNLESGIPDTTPGSGKLPQRRFINLGASRPGVRKQRVQTELEACRQAVV